MIGVAAALGQAAWLSAQGALPSAVATAVAAAFLPYALLLLPSVAARLPSSPRMPVFLAAVVGAMMLFAPPVLSDDVFRYLWDAKVARAGVDPYAFAPADPALAHLRDALHRRVNHPEVPTIYPPLAIGLFSLASAVHHGVFSLKALALAAHLASVVAVGRLCARISPERASHARWLLALCPLALAETALGGHVDVFAGLALLLAAGSFVEGRHLSGAVAVVVAIGTKLVGLLALPWLLRRHRLAGIFALVAGLLTLLPLLGAGDGSGVMVGLGHYAHRWSGNGGVHALVLRGARSFVAEVGDADGDGMVTFASLPAILRAVERSPLDPRASYRRPKKEPPSDHALPVDVLARSIARLGIVLSMLLFTVVIARRVDDPLLALRHTVLAALLLSPQLHPWYVLWLIPLEVATGRRAGLVLAAAVLVAYAPLDGWILARQWREVSWMVALEHGLVLTAVAAEQWLGEEAPVAARGRGSSSPSLSALAFARPERGSAPPREPDPSPGA